MKTSNIFILLLFLTSCKSLPTLGSMKGVYNSENPHRELILNDDLSFTYCTNQGLAMSYSAGNWFISENKYIILNSFENYRLGYIEVDKKRETKKANTRVILLDEDKKAVVNAVTYINNNFDYQKVSDKNGIVSYDNYIESFSIYTVDGVYTVDIHAEKHYVIDVIVAPKEFRKTYFKEHVLEIKAKHLSDTNSRYRKIE